jgi:hypothetical protein
MKLIGAVAFATIVAGSAMAAAPPVPADGRSVALQYGTSAALSEEAAQALYLKAVELLESSQFNSGKPRWSWDSAKILEEHRQVMSGKHLVVTFRQPQKVATMGGELGVRQIIIGLNRPDYASSLLTVDAEGRVVGHGKYSGGLCIEFLKLVKTVAGSP